MTRCSLCVLFTQTPEVKSDVYLAAEPNLHCVHLLKLLLSFHHLLICSLTMYFIRPSSSIPIAINYHYYESKIGNFTVCLLKVVLRFGKNTLCNAQARCTECDYDKRYAYTLRNLVQHKTACTKLHSVLFRLLKVKHRYVH